MEGYSAGLDNLGRRLCKWSDSFGGVYAWMPRLSSFVARRHESVKNTRVSPSVTLFTGRCGPTRWVV